MNNIKNMACVQGNPDMLKEQCLVAVGSYFAQCALTVGERARELGEALVQKGNSIPATCLRKI